MQQIKEEGAKQFQSTLSLRRATIGKATELTLELISIHALLAESDRVESRRDHDFQYFNPRSPCGERP